MSHRHIPTPHEAAKDRLIGFLLLICIALSVLAGLFGGH